MKNLLFTVASIHCLLTSSHASSFIYDQDTSHHINEASSLSPVTIINHYNIYINEGSPSQSLGNTNRRGMYLAEEQRPRVAEILREYANQLLLSPPSPSQQAPAEEQIVDLRDKEFLEIPDILNKFSQDNNTKLNLDFSDRSLSDYDIETLVEILQTKVSSSALNKIEKVNLKNNSLNVQGLQFLIPILQSKGVQTVDVSQNYIDSEDLFEKFGTEAAYSSYIEDEEKIVLNEEEHKQLLKKIVWIPESLFDFENDRNPTGMYINEEIIKRHRQYYRPL